jgi:hypothetical protein
MSQSSDAEEIKHKWRLSIIYGGVKMKHTTAKVSEWQRTGGVLEIPDGWFVYKVDLDVAYYLSTHFCGSKVMHENIEEDTRRGIKNAIMSALGL